MVILHKPVGGLTARALERFIGRAKRAVGLAGAVNVLVASSAELRRLNRRFRGKDQPTDVLSFPPLSGVARDFAGDVAISATIAAQNARRLGHSAADEVRILALHGVLHLAGYDHERDGGRMARKEVGLRQKLGLPCGLIERSVKARSVRATTEASRRGTGHASRRARASAAVKSRSSR
jgi:probable rRNA maturation factor